MSSTVRTTTPEQMSLALFSDMLDLGLPVNKAPKDIGYQRNNIFTSILDLGVTARRFLDAAYFIVAQEPVEREIYQVDLDYFRWLMRYDSRNIAHLRKVAQETQKALLQVTDTLPNATPTERDVWASSHLIGSVIIKDGRMNFTMPPGLVKHVRATERSHWLSLRIAAAFTLNYARVLYDRLLPLVEEGRTDWIPLGELFHWAGKAPNGTLEFKYFRRDYLEPAVEQISALSDIKVDYTVIRQQRRVSHVRFKIEQKAEAVSMHHAFESLAELWSVLTGEFALRGETLDKVAGYLQKYGEERIKNAIEYTRLKNKQGLIKKSPGGYLVRAIEEGYVLSEADRTMLAAGEADQQRVLQLEGRQAEVARANRDAQKRIETKMTEEFQRGLEFFLAMPQSDRDAAWAQFLKTASGIIARRHVPVQGSVTEETMRQHASRLQGFCTFLIKNAAAH